MPLRLLERMRQGKKKSNEKRDPNRTRRADGLTDESQSADALSVSPGNSPGQRREEASTSKTDELTGGDDHLECEMYGDGTAPKSVQSSVCGPTATLQPCDRAQRNSAQTTASASSRKFLAKSGGQFVAVSTQNSEEYGRRMLSKDAGEMTATSSNCGRMDRAGATSTAEGACAWPAVMTSTTTSHSPKDNAGDTAAAWCSASGSVIERGCSARPDSSHAGARVKTSKPNKLQKFMKKLKPRSSKRNPETTEQSTLSTASAHSHKDVWRGRDDPRKPPRSAPVLSSKDSRQSPRSAPLLSRKDSSHDQVGQRCPTPATATDDTSLTTPKEILEPGMLPRQVHQENPEQEALLAEGMEGDMFPESTLDTPIGALRKSRKRLCHMLNIEQVMVESDYVPDYRGLADLLGFDAVEIENFWERNPSDTLFMEWAQCRDPDKFLAPQLKTLVDCLRQLGREDILEECRGLILEDVSDHIAEQQLLNKFSVNKLETFDCYVNIADEDLLTIGREIVEILEGVYGLRLCLTLRDVSLGGFVFDEMAKMLETRCKSKVVIVLSKNYENSDACQFLTQFAVTLDPGAARNKLIPLLVDEGTAIPRVLRALAMLNFYRDRRLGFLWPRLKQAIQS